MRRPSITSEAGCGRRARHALVCERRQPRRKGDRDTRGEFMEQHRVREEREAGGTSWRAEAQQKQGKRTSSPAVVTDGPLGLRGLGGRGRGAGDDRGLVGGRIVVGSGAGRAQTGGGIGLGGWGGRHGGYEVGRVVFGLHPGGGIRGGIGGEGRGGQAFRDP